MGNILHLLNNLQIGQNLKDFATKNFPSKAEFARQLGMNNSQQLYDYFNGSSLLGAEKLAKLAQLGCDLNWLLNGDSNLKINEPREGYGMNYKSVLEENKKLQSQLNQLKIMVFDLQEETKILKLQLNDTEQVNCELLQELNELKKGLSTTD